jgi:hypothetical protein
MNASAIPILPHPPGVKKRAARKIKFLSTLHVLILAGLITGCDHQPRLKVNMTRSTGNDALFMLGAQPFVFDIDYSGTATAAELYIQAFKDGKLTKPYAAVGGFSGFAKPVHPLKIRICVNIFDSRTSVMKLANPNKIDGDFFRFVSDTKYENSEGSGGITTISTDEMEYSGMQTWGLVYHPDLSKEFIPVGYLKSTKKSGMSVGAEIPGDGSKLEEGCDYVVFYLKLNKHAGP